MKVFTDYKDLALDIFEVGYKLLSGELKREGNGLEGWALPNGGLVLATLDKSGTYSFVEVDPGNPNDFTLIGALTVDTDGAILTHLNEVALLPGMTPTPFGAELAAAWDVVTDLAEKLSAELDEENAEAA